MSILSGPIRPVSRSCRRLVKPVRVSPRPDAPFGEGLLEQGISFLIGQRNLTMMDSRDLIESERRCITGHQNQVRTTSVLECPEASLVNLDQVVRKATTDEPQRLVATAGKMVQIETKPASKTPIEPSRSRQVQEPARLCRRQPYTASDVQWWAANSPTRHDGYEVVSTSRRWDSLAGEAAAQSRLELGLFA